MYIQFTLSMPNVGSWNGRWSGRENLYAVVHSFTGKLGTAIAKAMLAKRSFYYNFGDGWGASVSVSEITGAEVRRVRKASKGFCGYEWMIESIRSHGVIYGPTRQKPTDAPAWPPIEVDPKIPVNQPAPIPNALLECPF